MGWEPALDESQCSQQCSEFVFSTGQSFFTAFEVFLLACLSWQGAQPRSPFWVWKSPWHFHTSFQHRLEMACSPLIYILHTTPKLLVVVMGWCSMVWVSHRFPLWRSPCEIWGVEGHLRWGGWIPFSTPQMECVGTASLSLCASGAAINNRSNQHLSFSGLLKAGVNLNSLYHENSWGRDFLPNSVPASLTFQSSGLSGLRRKTVSCACCALGSVFVWLKYSVT